MWHSGAISVSSTYVTVTCEVHIMVGCVFVHKFKNVGSTCPFSIMAESHICNLAAILFSDGCPVCLSVTWE